MKIVPFKDAAILAHVSRNRDVLGLKKWKEFRAKLETKLAKTLLDRLLRLSLKKEGR